MKYQFYTATEKAWDAMLEAVTSAQKSVYFESYIFMHNTEEKHNFIKVLSERARAGVTVKVVVDRWGSWGIKESQEEVLRLAGVELVYYSKLLRRIHRKVLIIDEKVGFLGGVNVGIEYKGWIDLHLRIEDTTVIKALTRSFWRSYVGAGGIHKSSFKEPASLRNRAEMWLLDHRPGKTALLKQYYQEQIAGAQHSIDIVSPYFVPHRWFVEAIFSALKRGVVVNILVPGNTDVGLMRIPNLISAVALSPRGVNFFFMRSMNHAKALLVDNRVALVGSQNIDALSFDHNAEVGVSFTEPRMVRDLGAIIEKWKEDSDLFSHSSFQRKWYHPIVEWVVSLIQPVL